MLRYISFIFATVFISSCQAPAPSPTNTGGSVIGNGLIKFQHGSGQFSFDYNESLSLSTPSPAIVKLDNSLLAGLTGRPVSTMTFEVLNTQELTPDGLKEFAANRDPNKTWRAETVANAATIMSRTESAHQVSGDYFFYLSSTKVLYIQINAVSDANGLTLILPVLDTLTIDTESPVIHEVFFEPATVQAGETTKLKIRATDNLSRIVGRSPGGSVSVYIEQSCRELVTEDWNSADTCGDMRELGNGWYEIDIPTSPHMASGDYVIYPLIIWDTAGNPRHLVANHNEKIWQSSLGIPQKAIPLHYLTVQNPNQDNVAPMLANARFEPAIINAGESADLVFDASDNETDFVPQFICRYLLHPRFFDFLRDDAPENTELDRGTYGIRLCGTPKKRSDGAWAITVDVAPYMPPGPYAMVMDIKDSASNLSEGFTVRLYVKNDAEVDRKGPNILDIKANKDEFHPGETGSVLFRAVDDLSGVAIVPPIGLLKMCNSGFTHQQFDAEDDNNEWRVPLCDSRLRHVEGDWYAIDFTLGDNIPTGAYQLGKLIVSDKVGNRSYIELSSSKDGVVTYRNKYNGDDTGIPAVVVRVTSSSK